jgi:hypothetical protein
LEATKKKETTMAKKQKPHDEDADVPLPTNALDLDDRQLDLDLVPGYPVTRFELVLLRQFWSSKVEHIEQNIVEGQVLTAQDAAHRVNAQDHVAAIDRALARKIT